jgi:P27 family predicted phage terminase small subunit
MQKKSAKERRLDGNPGRRPIHNEPDLPKWIGDGLPPYAPKEAQAFYEMFVPQLKLMLVAAKIDEPAIVLMCASWGLSMKALSKVARAITKRGRNRGKADKAVRNPAHSVWNDNVKIFLSLASRFGMTPADRARLFGGPTKKEEEGDTLDGNWVHPGKPENLN